MDINVFRIGCTAEYHGKRFIISGVETDHLHFKGEGLRRFDVKECTPVFRHLSSMTDEEKKEFGETFFEESCDNIKTLQYDDRSDAVVMICYNEACSEICNIKAILWLMSKGFWCGQCEETECILER